MKHMPMKRANDDHGAGANPQGSLCKNRNITSGKTIKRKFPVRCPPYRKFILIIGEATLLGVASLVLCSFAAMG
mgnify:FL=1|jgi:hypothetical protein